MDRTKAPRVPKLCRHKASGQGVVRLDGRDFYCGAYETKEAQAEYDRLIAVFLGSGRRMPGGPDAPDNPTVTELIAQYWTWAKTYYRRPDGAASSELSCIKVAVTELRRMAGDVPAREFGPLRLKALQDAMIARKWVRRSINAHAGRVRRMFAWAVANELLPPDVLAALKAVSGLKAGRCAAPDREPVRPVAAEDVERVLPYLTAPVAAMVRLMALTGMRVSEVAGMRMQDVDRTAEVWIYRPARHKTSWRGRDRSVPLGPQAQDILRPFLRAAPAVFLFQPGEGDAQYRGERRAERVTPLRPADMRREDRAASGSGRRFAERYDKDSVGHAVRRACKRAGVTPWHVHQLRHSVATRVQQMHGLDAARAVLGHSRPDTTLIYAERDTRAASRIAASEG